MEPIQQENIFKEQIMNDPLHTCNTHLNRNLNRNIDVSKVEKHAWKMKNKKSPGIGNLPYEVLKHNITINALTHFFTSRVAPLNILYLSEHNCAWNQA